MAKASSPMATVCGFDALAIALFHSHLSDPYRLAWSQLPASFVYLQSFSPLRPVSGVGPSFSGPNPATSSSRDHTAQASTSGVLLSTAAAAGSLACVSDEATSAGAASVRS